MEFEIYQRTGSPVSVKNEMDSLLSWCKEVKSQKGNCVTKGEGVYYNFPCSFDIETTSYEEKGDKYGLMYAYVLGVDGKVFVGRTWKDFMDRIGILVKVFELNSKRFLTIYVHNLAYEFQFIRKLFVWSEVFCTEERKVIYSYCKDYGIIFRCSYILSGYSLEKVGEHLQRYKVQKRVGDLDYSLRRGHTTPLTDKEWGYIYNDGLVVMAYIQEEIENNKGSILKIPRTKTGYVRRFMRSECLYGGKSDHKDKESGLQFTHYRSIIAPQTLEMDEYRMARKAFAGGFTHANLYNVNLTHENVRSMDFTSSYPAVRIREKYPCSKGKVVRVYREEQIDEISKTKLCIFAVRFHNLKSNLIGDNYLSVSKTLRHSNDRAIDNGRIIRVGQCDTILTNIDWEIRKKAYTWDKAEIGKCYVYEKQYLPTEFIKGVVSLYKKKTTLKGVKGREQEYRVSKENLNSCYGRCVTDICRDEIVYTENDEWTTEEKDIENDLDIYNNSKRRFLNYLWGVFVTAYARRNLWTAIAELGDDYIYSDTDSVKYRNPDKHQKYFDEYNAEVEKKLKRACSFHKIPFEDVTPKTIKGVTKRIGVWDFDGNYQKFKTLGAKRYLVQYPDGSINITISGVSKEAGVKYLWHEFKNVDNIFDNFCDSLIFPSTYLVNGELVEGAGKKIHTYIDNPTSGEFTDYLGYKQKWTEQSSIHLEPTSYSLSMTDEYMDLIRGIRLAV